MKCLLGGLIAVIITVALGYLIWSDNQLDMWKISGMLVGVYTRGTPNLASIQAALDVKPEHFIRLNTLDILLSIVFLLFIFTLGKPLFGRFLGLTENESDSAKSPPELKDKKESWKQIAITIIAAMIIVAIFCRALISYL